MTFIKGHCLCKSIQFKINSEYRKSVFCHCTMCQRSNSEFSLYTKVNLKNFIIIKKNSLKWYSSSKYYKRGFCSKCGSSLFFSKQAKPSHIAVITGCLNVSVPAVGHIYYQDKKNKLTIGKNLKKFKKSSKGYFDNMLQKIK
ncbi:GFA family protein [Alphaproteobacteria bacterium]|nr:GFA family protein [Alphaproteobacteria bacterium]